MNNNRTSGFIGKASAVLLSASGLFTASVAQADDSAIEQLQSVAGSWPEAQLAVSLESGDGADDKVLVLGEAIRYQLASEKPGSCYLLHFDSHGNATLMKPERCSEPAADGQGVRTGFPETGSLAAGQPLGQETVFAILAEAEIDAAESLLTDSKVFASVGSDDALAALVTGIGSAADTSRVALASMTYQVDSAEEAVQYTTRGIIRKVQDAKKDPSADGVLASFDVQSIQFDFGSDELTEASKLQLDAFGAALQSNELTDTRLKVAGHTDDQGDEVYNDDLSLRRATAVRQYFEKYYKVPGERMEVVGYGETKPLADNSDPNARAKNRRVEMVFVND